MRRALRPCVIIPSFRDDYQTLELMLVDQAALEAALDVLKALALMPSKLLGFFSLTLELVLSRRRICAVLGGWKFCAMLKVRQFFAALTEIRRLTQKPAFPRRVRKPPGGSMAAWRAIKMP